uniref:Cysteine-rich secretory protein n=1 Tax=Centruroides hentzi TaxID=88313 RepID=A0A2I9LNV7_9SCOR
MKGTLFFDITPKLIFLLIYLCSSVLSDCPALYKRYSHEHTFCKAKNQKCLIKKWGVSEDDQEIIIDLHNKVRNNIAVGKDQSGRLPAAGDMLEMEWDDELAQIAQKLADQCVFKHDCDDCRKVENFDVGQNIYTSTITAVKPPEPFWVDAVRSWYSEIYRFTPDFIKPFTSDHATGHFTQLAWSTTWRVGCGYVLYEKRRDSWTQLYVCNYGPAGNIDDSEMYKVGKPCDKCPGNTCCGEHCKTRKPSSYFGLCKVLNGRGPDFDETDFGNFIFDCDFRPESSSDCNSKVEGVNKWQTRQIISDVYKTVVLNGGESSCLKFSSNIQSKNGFCLTVSFRKGPNVAGTKSDSKFDVELDRKGAAPLSFELDSEGNQWLPYSMGIPMNRPMQINLKFSVPKGSPAQYLDINYVRARPGVCE